MKISKVAKCRVNDCVHNFDNVCHAVAVTIGEDRQPRCNAFHRLMKEAERGRADRIAGVGVCKVSSCIYNTGLKCRAPEVFVNYKGHQPECFTFQPICSAHPNAHGVLSDNLNASTCPAPEIFIG